MISAQKNIVLGFISTVWTEVWTATAAPTSRSRSSGNEITLMLNTTAAKTKPIRCPRMISVQPREVVRTSFTKPV